MYEKYIHIANTNFSCKQTKYLLQVLATVKKNIWDAGYRILDTVYGVRDTGYGILDTGYGIPDT